MNKLIIAALAGTLTVAAPVAVFAAPLYADAALLGSASEIRVIPVTSVGGSVDGLRAAAVAGAPVQEVRWIGENLALVENLMDSRDVNTTDIDAIYTNGAGTFWVYVTSDDRDDRGDRMSDPA